MKNKDLVIYGAAAVAGWLIWQNRDALFGGAKASYTAGANPWSPWFGYQWGTLNLPGYTLFDGAMDSLGLTFTNYDQGGLGLKAGGGLGLSYAGARAGSSGGASGSW